MEDGTDGLGKRLMADAAAGVLRVLLSSVEMVGMVAVVQWCLDRAADGRWWLGFCSLPRLRTEHVELARAEGCCQFGQRRTTMMMGSMEPGLRWGGAALDGSIVGLLAGFGVMERGCWLVWSWVVVPQWRRGGAMAACSGAGGGSGVACDAR
ncbi:hypothetical protein ACLOJK_016873 [Asimina triloba]